MCHLGGGQVDSSPLSPAFGFVDKVVFSHLHVCGGQPGHGVGTLQPSLPGCTQRCHFQTLPPQGHQPVRTPGSLWPLLGLVQSDRNRSDRPRSPSWSRTLCPWRLGKQRERGLPRRPLQEGCTQSCPRPAACLPACCPVAHGRALCARLHEEGPRVTGTGISHWPRSTPWTCQGAALSAARAGAALSVVAWGRCPAPDAAVL